MMEQSLNPSTTQVQEYIIANLKEPISVCALPDNLLALPANATTLCHNHLRVELRI